MKSNEEEILAVLRQLEQQRFFGSIELKLEAGRVVLLRKTETIKLTGYRDNRGVDSDHS